MTLLVLATLLGCVSECESDTRLTGSYAVESYARSPTADIQGSGLEDYPMAQMFFNGWSAWELEYVPSADDVLVQIEGQPFTAEFERAPDDCKTFTLGFSGTFISVVGSRHSFQWNGALQYEGPHLSGTWSYEDSWSNDAEGTSGTISIPEGWISFDAGGQLGDSG